MPAISNWVYAHLDKLIISHNVKSGLGWGDEPLVYPAEVRDLAEKITKGDGNVHINFISNKNIKGCVNFNPRLSEDREWLILENDINKCVWWQCEHALTFGVYSEWRDIYDDISYVENITDITEEERWLLRGCAEMLNLQKWVLENDIDLIRIF